MLAQCIMHVWGGGPDVWSYVIHLKKSWRFVSLLRHPNRPGNKCESNKTRRRLKSPAKRVKRLSDSTQTAASRRFTSPGRTPRYVSDLNSDQLVQTGSQQTHRGNQNTRAQAGRVMECQKPPLVFSQMPEKINVSAAHILPGKGVFAGLICAGANRAGDIETPIRSLKPAE